MVVATYPQALEIVSDLETEVRFEFDERISERVSGGAIDDAITISPRSGDVRVKHSSRALSLELERGLAPGVVYRVTLGAVVADLFGNQLTDPFELVFSTGGEPVATTLAGEVWDRITGRAVAGAKVLAIGPDSLIHSSVSDRDGIFAFRYMQSGSFTLTAFDDTNRDGEVDSMEVQGDFPASLAAGDTILIEIPILQPDTSAANVTAAAPVDSVTLEIVFDDFLDYEAGLEGVSVELTREDGPVPTIVRSFHEGEYVEFVEFVSDSLGRLDSIDAAQARALAAAEAEEAAAAAAAADSAVAADTVLRSGAALAPDTVLPSDTAPVPDTLLASGASLPDSSSDLEQQPTDTVVVRRTGAGALRGGAPQERVERVPPTALEALDGATAGRTRNGRRVLPGRRLIVVVDGPLEMDVEYEISASGVVNMNGLEGGSGTTTVMRETAPVDTTAARDSAQADTLRGDTTGIDTLRIDTTLVDTMRVDTMRVGGPAGLR